MAIPDAFESGNVVQQARQFKPGLSIIARAHSDEEFEHLRKHGASAVVMGENEMARAMLQTRSGGSAGITGAGHGGLAALARYAGAEISRKFRTCRD